MDEGTVFLPFLWKIFDSYEAELHARHRRGRLWMRVVALARKKGTKPYHNRLFLSPLRTERKLEKVMYCPFYSLT